VNSKRLISVGLAAILSLTIALPVFAQGNENKDYNSIQDERDQRKKRDMLEKFLKDYPNSQHRPQYDIDLITLYYGNKDWALIVKHADGFAQTQATADPAARSNFFTLAMEAARQLNNTA
jgi:outer membrane protein assembly factor BamD (BamD/ComL family)